MQAPATTWLNRSNWFVHSVDSPAQSDSVNPRGFALSLHVYLSCTDEFAFTVDHGGMLGRNKMSQVESFQQLACRTEMGELCNERALDRGHQTKASTKCTKIVQNMSEIVLSAPQDNFRIFLGHFSTFSDILSTFPFSGLSNVLPVARRTRAIVIELSL